MTDSNTYIQHLHAFRGFAILNVVGAHAWSFMIFWTGGLTAPGLDWLFWSAETIFHGSTLYFAIISGILFTRILKGKSWKQFFQSKFTNVLLPYIVTTLLLTAYYWQLAVQNEAVNHTLTDYLTAAFLHAIDSGEYLQHGEYEQRRTPLLCAHQHKRFPFQAAQATDY